MDLLTDLIPNRVLQNGETFRANITKWFERNGRRFPWRETRDPFKILIAEVTLKLTGAWKAEKVYDVLVKKFGTPALMAEANLPELAEAFRPLGLHTRANLIVDMAKALNERFNGNVPKTYDELISLKGVGRYTANAVLCLAYSQHVPLVDGSTSRVFRRCFGFHTGKEAYADKDLWAVATELLPEGDCRDYNLALLDFASLICKYRNPLCNSCPVTTICYEIETGNERSN